MIADVVVFSVIDDVKSQGRYQWCSTYRSLILDQTQQQRHTSTCMKVHQPTFCVKRIASDTEERHLSSPRPLLTCLLACQILSIHSQLSVHGQCRQLLIGGIQDSAVLVLLVLSDRALCSLPSAPLFSALVCSSARLLASSLLPSLHYHIICPIFEGIVNGDLVVFVGS
jgi:hypothetical protein